MTRAEIDILWQRAMQQAVKDGEMFTRYHFAALVAKNEREACAQVCDPEPSPPNEAYIVRNNKATMRRCAAAIRARSST